jgi:hypothetical protein
VEEVNGEVIRAEETVLITRHAIGDLGRKSERGNLS